MTLICLYAHGAGDLGLQDEMYYLYLLLFNVILSCRGTEQLRLYTMWQCLPSHLQTQHSFNTFTCFTPSFLISLAVY